MVMGMGMARSPAADRNRRADELGEIWSRVSRQHLTAGAGCSCGFGGLMFQAADFELDIVEFVITEAQQAHNDRVEAFINSVSRRGPDRYSLPALLSALARGTSDIATGEDLDFALDRLTTTLSSMDRSHARGRFACD